MSARRMDGGLAAAGADICWGRRTQWLVTNPIGDGYVYVEADGQGGSLLRFDRDAAGPNPRWPNTIIGLNIAPSQVSASDWIIG